MQMSFDALCPPLLAESKPAAEPEPADAPEVAQPRPADQGESEPAPTAVPTPVEELGSVSAAASGAATTGRREAAHIPSSTLKESVIGPPDEEDLGDVESAWVNLRGRHWLSWIGLTGVIFVILFFIGQAIIGTGTEQVQSTNGIASVFDLPDQFSGIVRLNPTTERFVTLQIDPADSISTTNFVYKMWTHSAGSTYAETGEGSLNASGDQILMGAPYGVGGLFVLEDGEVRLRSVRRVRFPRWEFTGHLE